MYRNQKLVAPTTLSEVFAFLHARACLTDTEAHIILNRAYEHQKMRILFPTQLPLWETANAGLTTERFDPEKD